MPGFSEMEKHFSDFNKPIRKENAFVESIKDGFDSVSGMFLDIGCNITEPIYDRHLQIRIEKDTKKFEIICKYAKMTGNRLWIYYSDKYEKVPCTGKLITDGNEHLLVEMNTLRNWMLQGIVVVNGLGLENSCGGTTFSVIYKQSNVVRQWVVPPANFNKSQCSNLRAVYKMAKQYLKSVQ